MSPTDSAAPAPPFGAQLIGRTEKALNGFLTRALAGTGMTEADWVALRLMTMAGPAPSRVELAAQLASVFKVPARQGDQQIDSLIDLGLIAQDGPTLDLTVLGLAEHERIAAQTNAIAEDLWGDLPTDEVDTAARVLATILARADAQLVNA